MFTAVIEYRKDWQPNTRRNAEADVKSFLAVASEANSVDTLDRRLLLRWRNYLRGQLGGTVLQTDRVRKRAQGGAGDAGYLPQGTRGQPRGLAGPGRCLQTRHLEQPRQAGAGVGRAGQPPSPPTRFAPCWPSPAA